MPGGGSTENGCVIRQNLDKCDGLHNPSIRLPSRQFRWNTSEEIYAILNAYTFHSSWLTHEVQCRPVNGSMLLFNRSSVPNYRKDGYVWKRRKDGKHYREDHMKLRVKGADCIYGSYAHSALLKTFHRRCYYLINNPDIILIHYLNAPLYMDKLPLPSLKHCASNEKMVWTEQELRLQLKPMYDVSLKSESQHLPSTEPVSETLLNKIIQELLDSQVKPPEGVQVAAQWVLSLQNDCSYLVSTQSAPNLNTALQKQRHTFQISNGNIKLLLGSVQPQLTQVPSQSKKPLSSLTSKISYPSNSSNSLMVPCPGTRTSNSETLGNLENLKTRDTSAPTQIFSSINGKDIATESILGEPLMPQEKTNLINIARSDLLLDSYVSHSNTKPIHESNEEVNDIVSGFDQSLQPVAHSENFVPMDTSTSLDASNIDNLLLNTELGDISVNDLNSTPPDNLCFDFSPTADMDSMDLFMDLNFDNTQDTSFMRIDEGDGKKNDKVKMTALAPEWSYSDGGCKILLIGPWRDNGATYTCLFGDTTVNAEIVQDGVLSCITPAHKEGLVLVKIACNDEIISESSNFEFRDRQYDTPRIRAWFICEESRLQIALVDRLEMMKSRLENCPQMHQLSETSNFEQKVTSVVASLANCKWRLKERLQKAAYKGMTLLHLASALGYKTFVEGLINWKYSARTCEALVYEVSLKTVDNNSCTAMHWACAAGKLDVALYLYKQDRTCLDDSNKDGLSALSLARAFRHRHVVEALEKQEHTTLTAMLDNGLKSSPNGLAVNRLSRRSASPTRSTPLAVRHPPVTRHNSTPVQYNIVSPEGCSSAYEHQIYHVPFHLTPPERLDQRQMPPPAICRNSDKHFLPLDLRSEYGDDVEDDSDNESSIVDVEGVSDTDDSFSVQEIDKESSRMRLLAQHIIDAIPERIKSTASEASGSVALLSYRERSSSRSSYSSALSYTEDSGVCTPQTSDWQDDINRTRFSGTSSEPGGSFKQNIGPAVLNSSAVSSLGTSLNFASNSNSCNAVDSRSESPPPSAQILGEYFNAGDGVGYSLSQLTLSDTEQRKLYQAACIIQNAFRQFKDKRQQQKEIEAAIVIQTYYRRFKEYTAMKNMQKQQAATRIQSQFRSYYAQKCYKRSRDAALLIQHHYRAYKEYEHFKRSRNAAVIIQQKFRKHYNRKKMCNNSSKDSSSIVGAHSVRDGMPKGSHHIPASTPSPPN